MSGIAPDQPAVFLLYHFFHPDDVISARLFSEMAGHFQEAGHRVVALPSVRSCHDREAKLSRAESWQGIEIRRMWRPSFSQASNLGRLINTCFMLLGWAWCAVKHCHLWNRNRAPVVVIGTDPIFGVLAAIPWRVALPRCKIVHWCHDLHPEATLADGKLSPRSPLVRVLRWLMRRAYRRCDVLVDLGPCMRELLWQAAGGEQLAPQDRPVRVTITPWSLVEPDHPPSPDRALRHELFGPASIGLLYSGNLGRAHRYRPFLDLARRLGDGDPRKDLLAGFCFAGRGVGIEELKSNLQPDDTNVRLAGFAAEDQLQQRLAAGDIHMVSLKESWTGTVVPSKFFGALAIGRPVLFVGAEACSLARWVEQFEVGWRLTDENGAEIATRLLRLASHPEELALLKQRCWEVYRRHFSRAVQMEHWDKIAER